MEISFQNAGADLPLLEDALNLLDQLSNPVNRTIVVFDEFQDIMRLGIGIDRKLRSIMQLHQNINYIILGSQESMMREIFEKKKSPFYHFGQLFPLPKIEKEHFKSFINTDKKTLINLTRRNISPLARAANIGPVSTVFSSLKRLMQNGNIIKSEQGYEIDDPFFKKWIIERRNL